MADAVVERIAELCAEIAWGTAGPGDSDGCMVSAREHERVLGMIDDARRTGRA
jgi:acyl-CoA reductase-like NAD-dependent aldehyde dehydrogenase